MKLKILKYKSYLQAIKNSVGSKIFRTCYATDGKKKIDIYQNGLLSCAFFVSSILSLYKLIDRPHATVDSTIKKMQEKGWVRRKRKYYQPGDVLVWDKWNFDNGNFHKHIGFYLGNKKAISNNFKRGYPVKHSCDFNRKRKIIAVYYWPGFENEKLKMKN